MSLQARLDAARSARRVEAGLPPVDRPAPDDEPIIIDLRDATVTQRLSGAPSFTTAVAVSQHGDTCPACGGPTRLDLIDIVGGVDHYACLDCQLLFQAEHQLSSQL